MTSNVGQSYPYSSETEADRAEAVARLRRGARGSRRQARRRDDAARRARALVGLEVPDDGLPGLLHAAGYARDLHAVYVVCDGTCGKTFLR